MTKSKHWLTAKGVACALGLALLLSRAANGAEYYVALNGNDTNNGTSLAAPFRTLQRAAETMVAGDTCFIRGGVYRETLRPVTSGTSSAPVTFTAYRNEIVTISGADIVANWSAYAGHILQAPISSAFVTFATHGNETVVISGADVVANGSASSSHIQQAPMNWDLGMGNNQVFVDGRMVFQARFPHMGPANSLMNPALTDVAVTPDEVASPAFNQPDGYWAGCCVAGWAYAAWSSQWAKVTASSSNGTLHVTPGSAPHVIPAFGNIAWFTGQGRMYLIGKLDLLGAPGEWDWEKNTLYLWPPGSDSMAAHLVEAKRRAWTVDFNGQNFVVVRGLRLFAGAVRMNGNHCALQNCQASYLSHFTLPAWSSEDGKGGAEEGYQGIWVSGDDNLITGCTIVNTAGSAIVLIGRRNCVQRCEIHDVDYSGTYGAPIFLGGSQNRIWFNTIHDTGRDIIFAAGTTGGTDADIRFNDLSHPGRLCKDLSVIYEGFMDAQGTRIAYNWIHDNPCGANGAGPGIYLDNYDRNFRVDHNVIWNCEGDAGIRINAPSFDNCIYNNTLFNCDDIGTHTFNWWPYNNPDPRFWTKNLYHFDAANNLYLGDHPESQLVDYAHNDFRLVPGAPAIDAGVRIPGYTEGYKGSAPDLGAYEFGGAHWTAGVNGVAPDALTAPGEGASSTPRASESFKEKAGSVSGKRQAQELQWLDANTLAVEGRGWTDTKSFYDRLPRKAEGIVREPVWQLSHDSAGMLIHFASDTPELQVRWTLTSAQLALNNMSASGVSGLDLYVKVNGHWQWLAAARATSREWNTATLFEQLPVERREFLLYLPLYNGIESLQLGIPKTCKMEAVASAGKPVVFYGTSIVQGCSASRPGMAYPAVLSRRLDRAVINLGFAGNSWAEPEMAALLAEFDPVAYVLDCLPNLRAEDVERLVPFVAVLRKKHPQTPIVLVENEECPGGLVILARRESYETANRNLRDIYDRLSCTDHRLYYVPTQNLIGKDGEGTVDGVHPIDLGIMRMADQMEPVLRLSLARQ